METTVGNFTKLMSHLSAQVVNRLLRENQKSITKNFLMVKNFKNVPFQISSW